MFWKNRYPAPKKPVNWKYNLAGLWVSQFLTLASFNMCLPFIPLYLREKRIVPVDEVVFWAGVFSAAAPVIMMIMSPIWGMLGDRYGRKMMLVRATLSGAFVLYLMSVVDNIEALIVLRMLQGAFTGSIASAQTLVVTATPERKQGFAVGFLMAAVNAGVMAGNFVGGILAMQYGSEMTFKIGGFLVLLSTIIVVAVVREDFVRPEPLPIGTQSARIRRRRESITNFAAGIPILLTVAFVTLVLTFDGPYISLYVDVLYRSNLAASGTVLTDADITARVFGIVGVLGGLASLAAMLGSIGVGTIMDRRLPNWVWVTVVVIGSLGVFWISRFQTIFGLALGRSIFLFFINGLASVLIVVLSRMTPSSKRGAALGWSNTTRSIGWAVAPMAGAFFAERYGFDTAYTILGVLCLLLAPVLFYLSRRYSSAFRPMDDDPPSIAEVGASQVSGPGGR